MYEPEMQYFIEVWRSLYAPSRHPSLSACSFYSVAVELCDYSEFILKRASTASDL